MCNRRRLVSMLLGVPATLKKVVACKLGTHCLSKPKYRITIWVCDKEKPWAKPINHAKWGWAMEDTDSRIYGFMARAEVTSYDSLREAEEAAAVTLMKWFPQEMGMENHTSELIGVKVLGVDCSAETTWKLSTSANESSKLAWIASPMKGNPSKWVTRYTYSPDGSNLVS